MTRTNNLKNSNSQPPPLPILHPPLYSSSNLMTTSFSNTFDKTENNLMSTSFTSTQPHTSFPFDSAPFNKPNNVYKKYNLSQSMNSVTDNFVPSLSSLNLTKNSHLDFARSSESPYQGKPIFPTTFSATNIPSVSSNNGNSNSAHEQKFPLPFGESNAMKLGYGNSVSPYCKNFMSTSFNDLDDDGMQSSAKSRQEIPDIDIVPPPEISSTLANYIQNLPKKNFPLSRSTPGLSEIDEGLPKQQRFRPQMLQNQNSVSTILQNHRKSGLYSTRTYRLNYDLDYVPFHGSCDNLDVPSMKVGPPKSVAPFKYTKLGLLHNSANVGFNREVRSNVPPLPVINAPTVKPLVADVPSTSNEKPKVKFSDTVTHILVPGSVRSKKVFARDDE